MIELEKSPLWMENVIHSLSSTQQFILHGNIYDFYPSYDEEYGYTTFSLSGFLAKNLYQLGYDSVLSFEPTKGFSLLSGDKNLLQTYDFSFENSDYMEVESLSVVYLLLKRLLSSKNHAHAVIFNFASALQDLSYSKHDYIDFFFNLFHDSLYVNPVNKGEKSLYNQITFLFGDANELPKWYQNSRIKYIKVPKPDTEVRKTIVSSIITSFKNYSDISQERKEKIVQRIAYLTEGMYGKELLNILLDAKKNSSKNLIEFIQTRKLNTIENPWLSFDIKLLASLKEKFEEINLICDDLVLEQIQKSVKIAYFNFSNLEVNSFLERPRGTMLFSGYHQEEQIQITQFLAKFIFKNEDSCLRVDMQEYVASSGTAKFLDNLSSHMSEFPYGVIVFENIQKGDSNLLRSVFDIVKHGKVFMKDRVLYFHGYIIVLSFSKSCKDTDKIELSKNTSNEIELKNFFEASDNSEIYSELRNNIIYFNPFDATRARAYLEKTLDETLQRVKLLHKVSIVLEDGAKEDIINTCVGATEYYCSIELKSIFHSVFVEPLTNLFIEMDIQEDGVILVKGMQDYKFEAELV